MSTSKTILIILDGWGHGDKSNSDAILMQKPHLLTLFIKNIKLRAIN